MKYVVVLPDGVSDEPIAELGNKTPLEVAKHPNIDWIAAEGVTGLAKTIPDGFPPGSDVGCMSVFGYDPAKHHTGRAPLEAAAQGIVLSGQQVAFRCNTLTVEDGVMVDHSADHITTDESRELIESVQARLGGNGVRFFPGVSYRHITVVDDAVFAEAQCTPPHDILGRKIDDYLPKRGGAFRLRRIMEDSVGLLKEHPINARRAAAGKRPATMLRFRGQGKATALPAFREAYGLRAACISAVGIVRGIRRLASFDILQVPGITGYFDTNYENKAAYALKALDDGHDVVIVHVESTDEAGHMGDVQKKLMAIEDTDRRLVGPLLDGLRQRGGPFAVMVVPDHPTSTKKRTHIAEPVPFAIYRAGGAKDSVATFTEAAAAASGVVVEQGWQLMSQLLGHKNR